MSRQHVGHYYRSTKEISCCTKYFLFSFNILFWLLGLLLLTCGIWAWTEKGFFDDVAELTSIPLDPVVVILSIGFVMFILSFSGCLGALRENICLLKFFSIILGIIFFAELVAGILAFVYKSWFQTKFNLFMQTTISKYRDDPDLQNLIDFSQQFLECCGGTNGPQDWENNVYFNCTSEIIVNEIKYRPAESCGVPFSCCAYPQGEDTVVDTQCGYGIRTKTSSDWPEVIWTEGCIQKFEDYMRKELYTVAGVFIGVALVQIVPICFAQNMISDIETIKASRPRH